MRSRFSIVLIAGLLFLGVAPGAGAGAWTQAQRAWYIEVTSRFLSSESELDFRGDEQPIFRDRIGFEGASYLESGVDLYAEYGLLPDLSLIAKLPIKVARSKRTELGGQYFESRNVSQSSTGPSDLFLGTRYRIWNRGLVASLEGGVKLPMAYDSAPGSGAPPLGNGEVDAEIKLLLGGSLGHSAFYATGGGGYRHRGGVYNDEILYEAETGWSGKRWAAQVKLFGISNTEEPRDLPGLPITTPIPGGGGAFIVIVGDQDVTQWEPSVSYQVRSGVWIRAGVSDVIAGKNTVTGTTGFLSIALR